MNFFLRVLILALDQIQFNFIFYFNAFSSESISRSFLLGRDFKQNLFLIKKMSFFPLLRSCAPQYKIIESTVADKLCK